MGGLGTGLQSLGQSLDPMRLSAAMKNFQDIQIREQEQKAFQSSLSQYDNMLSGNVDPKTASLWKQGEKMNPAHRSSFKSHQTFRASMAPAIESWRTVSENAQDLGLSQDDLEDIHRRIKLNPQQAPLYVEQVLTSRRALAKEHAVQSEVDQGLLALENGLGPAEIYRSLSPSARGIFAEQYKAIQSMDKGLGDDIANTVEGVRLLAQGIPGFNGMTPDQQLAAMKESNPDAFKKLQDSGELSRALQEMQAQQLGKSEQIGEAVATREQELAGGNTILGEPVRVASSLDGKSIDEIRLPGLTPQTSGIFGLGAVPTSIGPVKVEPTTLGRVHKFPVIDVLVKDDGSPSFVDPRTGKPISETSAVSKIMSDLGKDKGAHGKATNLSEAETVIKGMANDYEGLLTGIRKAKKSGEIPADVLSAVDEIEKDIQGKLDSLVLRSVHTGRSNIRSGTSIKKNVRDFKINKSNYRKKLAEELLGLKLIQTKYADAFRNF